MLRNLVKNDIYRCFKGVKYKIIFLLIFFFVALIYLHTAFSVIGKTSLDLLPTSRMSIILNPEYRSAIHLAVLIFPVISCLLYADSYSYEKEKTISNYYILRVNRKKYIISKAISIVIINFIAIYFAFGCNEIFTMIAVPNIGVANEYGLASYEIYGKTCGLFLPEIYDNTPHLYNFIIITIMSLYSACLGLFTLGFSLVFSQIKRLYQCIYVFLIVSIMTILLPTKYQVTMYIQTAPGELNSLIIALVGWLLAGSILIMIGIWKENL